MSKLKRGLKYLTRPKSLVIEGVIILALILAGIMIYLFATSIDKCEDQNCFSQSVVSCERSSFVADKTESIFYYEILGKKENSCEVMVRLLQVKQGTAELDKLRNKEMVCSVPLETYVVPEENLQNCHGVLKETIQEIIIQRMHSELVENLGEIKQELTEIL